jgi:hypothetical protein
MDKINPGKQVFGVTTPADMLAKLRRELARVANASFSHENLVDHATNCALTAWHITDWVWRRRFVTDQQARDHLEASCSSLHHRRKREDRFRECLTQMCPQLALCQDIANGFKHVIAEIPAGRGAPGVIDVTASAETAPPGPFTLGGDVLGGAGLGGPGYDAGGQLYRLKITSEDGSTIDAVDVFNKVVAFWTEFFGRHGIT